MSIKRRRLSPGESRDTALEAARALLLEAGPQAVTLKAVAAKIGRTHANLLHHFGSAAELQRALAESIAGTVTSEIGAAVMRARGNHDASRELLTKGSEVLCRLLERERRPDWAWFEAVLGYDNPRLSQALIEAGLELEDETLCRAGLETLEWIAEQQVSAQGTDRLPWRATACSCRGCETGRASYRP